MVKTFLGWGVVVARSHSGRRRLGATILYAVVIFLASASFAAGLVVRTNVGSRWDAAMRRGHGPHLVVTSANESALDDVAADARVVDTGPRVLSYHDTIVRTGTDAMSRSLPVDAKLVADTDNRPAGYVITGRWLDPAVANEVVLDAGVAKAISREVGDSVELVRGLHRGTFLVVGTALDLGNCLLPDCDPGAVWLGPRVRSLLGDVSYHSWVQGFRLRDPAAAASVGVDAWKAHGRLIRWVKTSGDVRSLVTLTNGLLGSLVGAFGMFVLGAAAILVASTTSARLASLRRDVGLLQVIGATNREVVGLVLLQNLAIGGLSAAAGALLIGIVRSKLVIGPAALLPVVDRSIISTVAPFVAVVALVEAIVFICTLIPAIRVGRLQPVEALRNETPNEPRASRWLPMGVVGVAWQTLRRQRRHYLVAALSLVVTGSAAMAASGYDAALTSFAGGQDRLGVRSDLTIIAGTPGEQERLRMALLPNSLIAKEIAATWSFTKRAVLVDGRPADARFVQGRISDLGFTVQEGRLPKTRDEAVVGFGLARSANLRVGSIATLIVEGTIVRVRIVGRVIDAAAGGRNITLPIDLLPADVRWGVGQAFRFRVGANLPSTERELLTMVLGHPPATRVATFGAYRANPYRIALALLAVAVLAVGCVQLASSLLVSIRNRARELTTLRAIGSTNRQIVGAHIVLAVVVATLASVVAIPLGRMAFRWSIDRIGSTIGVGAGIPVAASVQAEVALVALMLMLSGLVAWFAMASQLSKSMSEALKNE